ncbi:MAG TPA: hypothetical protein VMU93_17065 [Caulobacteraceae bacterium]|nr:hypothetical protein [Caulobacteraceae bacterium]
MVTAVAAAGGADALASLVGEGGNMGGCDRRAGAVGGLAGALRVGLSLVASGLQLSDPFLQRRIVQVGHAAFDRVIEAPKPRVGLGSALVQFGDVRPAVLGPPLPAVENGGEDFLQPFGVQQTPLQMAGYQVVQLLHRDRAALAADLALPGGDGAGVVAVAPALAGADGHGPAAVGAEADAGEQGRPADHAGRRDLRVAGFQMRLHGVEGRAVDQRRHLDRDHFGRGLELLGLAALVELVSADIGRSGQQPVELADTPSAAVAGEDAARVQMLDDRLDAHRTGGAVTLQGQFEGEPHGAGVQRVDLQLLLDLGAALLGRDHAITDRRQRAVPEPLARILLQGAQHVLGVLLGLVFVEQRHDLPHHGVHRVVTHLLGDRDQLDAVLRQLANVEFQLEMVAEEAAEGMDHHDVEGGRFGGGGLHHALELGAAVVGGGGARLHIGFDQLVAARGTVGFALAPLVGDGNIMLGLPRRRDPEVERGAKRHGHGTAPIESRSAE